MESNMENNIRFLIQQEINNEMTIFPKCYFEGGENMKKVSCTVMIHDNVDIDSVTVNLDCKEKTSERYRRIHAIKRDSNIPYQPEDAKEPVEGLLYDELY